MGGESKWFPAKKEITQTQNKALKEDWETTKLKVKCNS